MRYATLFLAAAFSGLMPVVAHAASGDPSAPTAMAATNSAVTPDSTPAPEVTPKTFSDSERAGIEAIIKNYLTKDHPEVIMEGVQELQKRETTAAESKSEEAISKSEDRIYGNPDTPVGGDPKGDVTVVEFFDFQCGYCKASEAGVEKLLKEDKKVKFLYKDFPILGPGSEEASKAVLAAIRQGKYIKLHDALMNQKEHLSSPMIYKTAKDVGLDVDKLKKDMADPAIRKMIDDNLALGRDIGVRGTPMFIINGQIFPGAIPYEQMKQAVDAARAAPKKP